MHSYRASCYAVLLLALICVAVPAASAQVPQSVAFQGFLTDDDGGPVTDEAASLTFRLYTSAQDGRLVWIEEHQTVPVDDGIFTVYLGSVRGFERVSFDEPLWLSMAVGDRSAEELSPRTPLSAVPYAIHGARADLAHGLDPDATGIVTANHIAVDAVGTEELAAASVTDDELAAEAVSTDKLQAGAVTTDRLASSAVDAERLAVGSVEAVHLVDGSVTLSKLDATGSSAGDVLVSDGQGAAGWGNAEAAWETTSDAQAVTTDRKVGIGIDNPVNVGIDGLEMVGRLRVRPRADLNRGNFVVRPTFSLQDESSSIRVGLVADTSSSTLIGGIRMEAEPKTDGVHGSLHLVTGRSAPNGGGIFWGRRITILSDGLVGVGTTDPQELLHVDGNVQADQFLTPSDRRLKERIEPLQDALSTVQSLRGVTFSWKDASRSEDGRQLGFIAQEVDRVLPEVVRRDGEGIHKVAYAHMMPVLVEAIKQQQVQIADLLERVRELELRLRSAASSRALGQQHRDR